MSDRFPLLLLPGLMDNEGVWRHQVRHLADVAAPRVCDLTGQDTIGAMADAVLAGAEGPFALAGFSMGGYVAFEVVRRAPEQVRALALVCTSARADGGDRARERQDQIRMAEAGRFEDIVAGEFLRHVHPDRRDDHALIDGIRAAVLGHGPEVFVRQQRATMTRPNSRPDLPRIACPTLVVCARQDAITTPEMAEEMAAGIPGARLATIEECGHYAPLERPHAVTALMRQWLLYP